MQHGPPSKRKRLPKFLQLFFWCILTMCILHSCSTAEADVVFPDGARRERADRGQRREFAFDELHGESMPGVAAGGDYGEGERAGLLDCGQAALLDERGD